jgi:hypothetical protein
MSCKMNNEVARRVGAWTGEVGEVSEVRHWVKHYGWEAGKSPGKWP